MSITGDVILTSDLIASLNTLTLLKTVVLPMRLIREIDKQHLSDIAEILDAPPTLSSARLYKAHVSRSTKLVNGNTICGPRDAEWLLLGETRDRLSLAVFSGDIEPALDSKSVAKSRDLCGTFSYDAAATE